MKMQTVITHSLDETLALAEKIGSRCVGGEVFELRSDLGGGKTAFTRGLVAGMGSVDEVSSPSFTINNTYKSGNLVIEHFDFYRLSESGVVGEELKEALSSKNCVVVIEWGDIVENVLSDKTIRTEVRPLADDSREFVFSYLDEFSYLFEDL
jgi:tRNA threonylcarbamoyladenosine biosynthesis protein TsaE